MARFFAIAALCLAAFGCGSSVGSPTGNAGDVLDVQEAAFRYQLGKPASDMKAYVAVDGKDPSPELLTRLRKDWPNLEPVSKEPKEKGHHIYVHDLKWIDQNTTEIKAGHWAPSKFGGDGSFATHHLVRNGGKWKVEKITDQTTS